jgi:aryl-alcohol dehydrogenase-like predicted oxidoreductase
MDDLVTAGKVLYIGAGGRQMTAWQFVDAWWTSTHNGWSRYASAQIEWSLLQRSNEKGSITAAEHLGMSVLPFFPLAAGLLSGKYSAGIPDGSRLKDESGYSGLLSESNLDRVKRLTAVARSEGTDILGLSLGWLARHPVVGSVISGATTPEQVQANATAVAQRISPDALEQIDLITLP